jgi:hypothetical protein
MGGLEKAPETGNQAAEKMKQVMPDMETTTEDQPITTEELSKMTKGYPEAKITKEHKDILDAAKKAIKEIAKGNDSLHKSNYTVVGKDGYEYVYVYDNTHDPKDRLFKSEQPVVSVENEYARANLQEGYTEATGKMAERIARAAARILGGDPPSTIVALNDLVTNKILSQDEADAINGSVAYIVKIKGKTKVFFGEEV